MNVLSSPKLSKPLLFVHILLVGLLAGFFLGSAFFFNPALNQLSNSDFITAQQSIEKVIGPVMPILVVGALVTAILVLITLFRAKSPLKIYFVLAFGLLVAQTITTLTVNVPINSEVATWSASAPPTNFFATRERWDLFNYIRTIALILAFIIELGALIRTLPSRINTQTNKASNG